jgi:hypothetical protein
MSDKDKELFPDELIDEANRAEPNPDRFNWQIDNLVFDESSSDVDESPMMVAAVQDDDDDDPWIEKTNDFMESLEA